MQFYSTNRIHLLAFVLVQIAAVGGCISTRPAMQPEHPDVSPAGQPVSEQVLTLDSSQIKPMYRELLAIDLPTVVRVTRAENFDILQARQQVEAMKGQFESTVGSAFPVIAPTLLFEHVEGTVRATEGDLVGVGFNTFQPSIAIQWVINPGKVIYEIVAAKKRMHASEHQEETIIIDTLRRAVVQYYELILSQAQIAAAQQAVTEAKELYRITKVRSRTGTGVAADELRAEARLAERQQDLAKSINAFYEASIALTLTLHLEATVTLVPSSDQISPVQLVRTDFDIYELLTLALQYRPDLQNARMLAEAAEADKGATWWGALGMNFQVGYQYGGISGNANNVNLGQGIPGNLIVDPTSTDGSFSANPAVNGLIKEGILRTSQRLAKNRDRTFGFKDQQRFNAGGGWRLGLSIFGDLKTASASEKQAILQTQRQLEEVRAQVIRAAQASETNYKLIALANQQVVAAEEALRLTQANLQSGTMTTVDVLQSQDAVSQARLRYAKAVVRYNQSQINLLASLGLLDEESFGFTSDDDKVTAANQD